MDRLEVLQACVESNDADALILTFMPDIRWLTGFSGSNALVVYTKGRSYFVTDGRYATQSRDEVEAGEIHVAPGSLMRHTADQKMLEGSNRVIVQAEYLTLSRLEEYKNVLPDVSFVPVSGILNASVAVKSKRERELIADSQRITDEVFDHLLGFVKPGMSEQDIAAEIVYQHLRRGASAMSFDPIVASGPNSALPHARPTQRVLQQGDMVVIDMGCFKNGYASDMTRTLAIGEPGEEARTVYQVVLDAQSKALEAASPNLTSKELDSAARSIIEDAGYGSFFSHSLGHGVGLQIHEWPSVSWKAEYPLQAGMIITIEPGIYIPDQFGVRIEDMIQLTETGCDNLTGSTKQLVVI
ncbi:MAG: aminopeptidase P family protein [Rhodothermaceae bacterium]|nr:aminopeptidase P family protein [Rhodothermaceae bacterium]